MARHVRKGDTVMVTSGDHKGEVGEVLRILTKHDQVIVKGINLKTKHVKPTRVNPQGSVITKEGPLHISKVSPVMNGQSVRVGFRVEKDGTKVRVARHKGKELGVLSTLRKADGAAPSATTGEKKSKASKKKA